jgi:hypothetical protein
VKYTPNTPQYTRNTCFLTQIRRYGQTSPVSLVWASHNQRNTNKSASRCEITLSSPYILLHVYGAVGFPLYLEGKGLGRGPTRHAETHVLARVRRRGNGGEERHVFHLHHQEQKALIMKLLKLVIPTTASHTLFVLHKIKP